MSGTFETGPFTADEEELREALLRLEAIASKVLCRFPGGILPVGEWVERRTPGLINITPDGYGRVMIVPRPPAPSRAPPLAAARQPPQEVKQTPSLDVQLDIPLPRLARGKAKAKAKAQITRPLSPPLKPVPADLAAKKEFFRSLPRDSFTTEEEELREVLMTALESGPLPLDQVMDDLGFSIQAVLGPSSVPLIEWIQHRIGDEVLVETGEGGVKMCTLVPQVDAPEADAAGEEATAAPAEAAETTGDAPPPEEASDPLVDKAAEFWDGLPADSFTEDESNLRRGILSFLARWTSSELTNLSHIGTDKVVHEVRKKFLPKEVSLREWIERRIGGEIELVKNERNQQFEVMLTELGRSAVKERGEELGLIRSAGSDQGPAPPVEPLNGRTCGKSEVRGGRPSNVEALPAEMGPEELELRKAILDFRTDRMGSKPGGRVSLASCGGWKPVKAAKDSLEKVSGSINLAAWIKHRMSSEVRLQAVDNGQYMMEFQRATDRRDGREAFFGTLPQDEFLPEESELREAVLDYIQNWSGPGPATMSKLGSVPRVRQLRNSLMKGGGSLKEWIERRIGEEVDTWPLGKSETAIGFPGDGKGKSRGYSARKRPYTEEGSEEGGDWDSQAAGGSDDRPPKRLRLRGNSRRSR